MTHEDARDTLPLLALDATDPETRVAIAAHVAECDACRRELEEYRQAADVMGQAVTLVQPRPELRARTLAAALGRPTAVQPLSAPEAVTPTSHDRPGPALSAIPLRTPGRWTSWVALAAGIAAVASTAALLQTRAELGRVRETLTVWQVRLAEAERNAQTTQATLVTYRQQLDVMTADDLLLVSLSGLPPAASAQAKAFVSQSRNTIVFTARDLPALPAAQVYQLWAVAGGQAISAGTFLPDEQGRGQLVTEVSALRARPDALAVTVEPQGGVPAPTGPKYLLGVPAN